MDTDQHLCSFTCTMFQEPGWFYFMPLRQKRERKVLIWWICQKELISTTGPGKTSSSKEAHRCCVPCFHPRTKTDPVFEMLWQGGQKTMFKTTVKQTEKLTHFTMVSLLKQNDNQIYHQLHLSHTLHFAHTICVSCRFLRELKRGTNSLHSIKPRIFVTKMQCLLKGRNKRDFRLLP